MVLIPVLRWIRTRKYLWAVVLLGAVFGALPDIISAYGVLILRNGWTLYVNAHEGPIAHVLQYIPMYGLHLFVDSITHGVGKRWWVASERLWLEILFWVINAFLIAWAVSRLRTSSTPECAGGQHSKRGTDES